MPDATSRRFDWIVTGLALLLPVLVFREAATSLTAQDAASGGPMRDAAFFPEVVAWALLLPIAANLFRLVRSTTHAPADETPGADTAPGPHSGQALLATGLFVAYLLLLPWAGFYLATPVLMLMLMRLFGGGWITACLMAAGLTLAVGYVFEGLLDVVLPLGFAKFTLFG